MPEIPDLELYRSALESRLVNVRLDGVRLASPFLVRSVEPKPTDVVGKRLLGTRRVGKRIVLVFEDELRIIIHLMIAGRFRYEARGATVTKIPGKVGLAAFDFETGTLLLTEASPKKRASLFVVRGDAAVHEHDPGGLEPLDATAVDFRAALRRENRTLKRALTDPTILAGIGNAYSDEILHAAKLSPTLRTGHLDDATCDRIHVATTTTLRRYIDQLAVEFAGSFPGAGDVTAFREDFAVHGRYRKPCPVCGSEVQRIRYADNESNYCPTCQTGGKLLADRSLSRLLGADWPRSLDELESRGVGSR